MVIFKWKIFLYKNLRIDKLHKTWFIGTWSSKLAWHELSQVWGSATKWYVYHKLSSKCHSWMIKFCSHLNGNNRKVLNSQLHENAQSGKPGTLTQAKHC
jgi:hypothetical protein